MMTMKNWIRIALALSAVAAIPACHGSDDDVTGAVTTYVQVERFGRPAINEGLFVTNDYLNAVNSISPGQDGAALVGPVFAEAAGTLVAFGTIGGPLAPVPTDVVAALIPDVMRIDTTIASPVGTAAYANGAVPVGTTVRPVAGRKLEDDVVDITYFVLTGVGAASDGVPYTKPIAGPGSTNPAIGHQLLNGQAAPNMTATFPFLAAPN
jgi:hypothetical protein